MPCHPDRVRRNYEVRGHDFEETTTYRDLPDRVWICVICGAEKRERGWRCPSDTNAEQLQRRSTDDGFTANVIEGESHDDAWGV